MATANIKGQLFKLDETADEGATAEAYSVDPSVVLSDIIPVQGLQATADASGDWTLVLSTDKYYWFVFTPTDTGEYKKAYSVRKYVTGTGDVNFSDLPDEA